MSRGYKEYCDIIHKDGSRETVMLSVNKLVYADKVFDEVEKARRKSRHKAIRHHNKNAGRNEVSWPYYTKDPRDLPQI